MEVKIALENRTGVRKMMVVRGYFYWCFDRIPGNNNLKKDFFGILPSLACLPASLLQSWCSFTVFLSSYIEPGAKWMLISVQGWGSQTFPLPSGRGSACSHLLLVTNVTRAKAPQQWLCRRVAVGGLREIRYIKQAASRKDKALHKL